MTRVVEVRTGARLHFGLFSTTPGDGPFGGIGMMIDRPGFVVEAFLSPRDHVDAPPDVCERVVELVSRVRRGLAHPSVKHQVEAPALPVTVRISRVIPPHRGFGSGTQLANAVATALGRALDVWPPVTLDKELGRGGRSAVGTRGFSDGGFLVDAGLRRRAVLDDGVTRREVPGDWRVVVVDPRGAAGPSGAAETSGFRSLPPMPRRMPELLFDLVAAAILPGLAGRDFRLFAKGISDFNRLVGEHFAPVQGGVYAHPLIRELSRTLGGTSWPYLAQSSWGPAAAVLCESEESAEALRLFLRRRISAEEADVFIAEPNNDGAAVTCLEQ